MHLYLDELGIGVEPHALVASIFEGVKRHHIHLALH